MPGKDGIPRQPPGLKEGWGSGGRAAAPSAALAPRTVSRRRRWDGCVSCRPCAAGAPGDAALMGADASWMLMQPRSYGLMLSELMQPRIWSNN